MTTSAVAELPELSEEKLPGRIMALFKDKPRLNTLEIKTQFADESEDSVKNAIARLRGKGGQKRLRVVGYVNYIGRPGLEVPVLEVGIGPDVERTEDSIEDNDELRRRARWVREKREEHSLRKRMQDLDNWFG